jgi:hypothetical protein
VDTGGAFVAAPTAIFCPGPADKVNVDGFTVTPEGSFETEMLTLKIKPFTDEKITNASTLQPCETSTITRESLI